MCFRLAFTPLEQSLLMTCSQDQSSLAALLEKNDELGGIAEAERLYDMFTSQHELCFCFIHRTLNECRYRHVARVQLEVLGSLHCSACLAMCVPAHCLHGFRFCDSNRYNLAAFLLVHGSSQRDEAADLLRRAHAVSRGEQLEANCQCFISYA